jgi:thiol-disulfide isomerase/thioredoxin
MTLLPRLFTVAFFVALLGAGATASAASADEDWKAIVALDAGPQGRPRTSVEARDEAYAHLLKQERALRAFLAANAGDAHAFEARLRLSRALQIRADMTADEALRAESKRLLDESARVAKPEQVVEVDFARITAFMRASRLPSREQRAELLTKARAFSAKHPADRRVAPLLTEVSARFDSDPKTKLELLSEAQAFAKDGELKARIADDLRRVGFFGKTFPLSGPTVQGRTANVEELRGDPVLVVFFADFSPPSITALPELQRAVGELPPGTVRVLGVSLDARREIAAEQLKKLGVSWPVICDGKGWESPVIRALGVNTLPTVWLLDGAGRLRSLNALEGTAGLVRQLRK